MLNSAKKSRKSKKRTQSVCIDCTAARHSNCSLFGDDDSNASGSNYKFEINAKADMESDKGALLFDKGQT